MKDNDFDMRPKSLNSRWLIQVRLIILGIFYQTQHYAFGYIASGSSMLMDTHVNNFEYSILSGPSMLFVSAITLMPLSRFSDYTLHPKWLLIGSTCISALITACNSFATNFGTLLWPRVLFSIVSGPIAPLNLRIMTDYFSIKKRGIASSTYFLSIYAGLACASLMLLFADLFGWRGTYLFLGGISLIGSLIPGLTLSSIKSAKKHSDVMEDVKSLYRSKTLIYCVIGLAFKYISQFTRASFESLYFARNFPDDILMYSILNTISLLLCPWSALILGKLSDDLEPRYPLIKSYMCAVTLLLPIPFFVVMYWTSNFILAMICIFSASLISEAYIGLSYAIMINVTIPRIRALQTAWMMSITMIAGGIAITIIGYTYNSIEDLRIALIVSGTLPLLLSAAMFFKVTKHYTSDLAEFSSQQAILVNSSEIIES